MTLSIESYLSRATDSLDAAELLLSEDFAEYAVSRAYYAMFYLAQAFLLEQGQAYSKHSGVISAFGRDIGRPGIAPRHFHRYLIEGQEARLLADYHGRPLSDEDARLHIDRGREFLEFAQQYFAGRQPTGF
jgi:uncharacterized protein (UPF0332 family)